VGKSIRLAVITGKGPSLMNVSNDIIAVARKYRIQGTMFTFPPGLDTILGNFEAAIFFFPVTGVLTGPHMLLYRDLKVSGMKYLLFYGVTEGPPLRTAITPWMKRDLEFVAVSNYVKQKLEEVGLKVIDVVYHGIYRPLLEQASKYTGLYKGSFRKRFGDKVIIGLVSTGHVRKGLKFLRDAVEKLSSKRDDFVIYAVTTRDGAATLRGVPNIFVDPLFGSRPRAEILGMIGAFDYLVVPSLSEGFCLPLIEANIQGVLAIHAAFEPLTEISDPQANFIFPYDTILIHRTREGIDFELHVYDPANLAEALEEAIEVKKNNPEEYARRSELARKSASRFDAEVWYKKLLRLTFKVGRREHQTGTAEG